MSDVFAGKFADLVARGFKPCGVLLSGGAEAARFVGLTQHGKVIWWTNNPPQPDELLDRIKAHEIARAEGRATVEDGRDLLEEAATEIRVLDFALRAMTDLVTEQRLGRPKQ